MKSTYFAAALFAAILLGSGCGGNGGGSGAVPTAQNTMVESTPRSVSGVTFLQEADHATYRTGQVMHLRFFYYLAQSQAVTASAALQFEYGYDYQPVRWLLTNAKGGQTLVPPTPPQLGEGGGGPPGYSPADANSFVIIAGAIYGFENDATAPAPGTYTLSAWSTATSTGAPGLDPPAAALQTTLYANPITIRVLP